MIAQRVADRPAGAEPLLQPLEHLLGLHRHGGEGGEDAYQCKGTLTGHKGAIWMLQYDEENQQLYSCCDDKKVICWDTAQLKQAEFREYVLRVMTRTEEYEGEARRRLTIQNAVPVNFATESKATLAKIQAMLGGKETAAA